MQNWKASLIALSLLMLLAPAAQGQTLGSSIVGVVKDQTGGVLPRGDG